MTITTRFAPSPTGHLHIGGLRTALYNYLYAKKNGGNFFLRIEDTDTQRNSKEALEGILEALKWVGLDYDMPVVYQSQRLEVYQEYAKKLLEFGQAYYCYLTKEELEIARNNNKGANHVAFSRKYRDYKGEIPKGIAPSIRIKSPLNGTLNFHDGVKGNISFNAAEIDDFVILRSDGTPTYNFVVVIDDALSGITDVIRGDDHISNTPKQLVIYQSLNFKIPTFYHIPMICNSEGKKLSKRDGALSVLEYRDAGILPQALLNFLFRLGYSYGDKEIFTRDEMLTCFEACDINSKASACNFSKLYWLNAEYIKTLEHNNLQSLLNLDILKSIDSHVRDVLFNEVKIRVNNLVDFRKEIIAILCAPMPPEQDSNVLESVYYDSTLFNKLFTHDIKQSIIESLESFKDSMSTRTFEDVGHIRDFTQDYIHTKGIKPSVFMQALRLALLGRKGGIDLMACLYILGVKESTNRINTFLNFALEIK